MTIATLEASQVRRLPGAMLTCRRWPTAGRVRARVQTRRFEFGARGVRRPRRATTFWQAAGTGGTGRSSGIPQRSEACALLPLLLAAVPSTEARLSPLPRTVGLCKPGRRTRAVERKRGEAPPRGETCLTRAAGPRQPPPTTTTATTERDKQLPPSSCFGQLSYSSLQPALPAIPPSVIPSASRLRPVDQTPSSAAGSRFSRHLFAPAAPPSLAGLPFRPAHPSTGRSRLNASSASPPRTSRLFPSREASSSKVPLFVLQSKGADASSRSFQHLPPTSSLSLLFRASLLSLVTLTGPAPLASSNSPFSAGSYSRASLKAHQLCPRGGPSHR